MSKAIVVRVKTKDGHHRVDCLTGASTLEDLKAVLLSLTGTLVDRIQYGYPLRPLELNDEKTLDQAQIRSGDTLIVDSYRMFEGVPYSKAPPATRRETAKLNEDAAQNNQPPSLGTPAAGILLRRVVPANNSCLFTSVYFGISGGVFDMQAGANLRQIIAEAVAGDPATYNEAFLGKKNREYCTWILNEDHWGGGIELAILSKHFRMEMVAVDTQNTRLNRFGEDENYEYRMMVIYDGIHYDPLMLEPLDGGKIQTTFPTPDEHILQLALELAHEAKISRQFTDVQNFTLRCLVCNQGVVGQQGAQSHAKSTGHTNFGEV